MPCHAGSDPELLALTSLKWGQGLPAGLQEALHSLGTCTDAYAVLQRRRTAPHRTDPPKRTGPLVQRLLCCAECDLITAICSIADSIAPNTGLARPVTHQVIFIERARRRRAFEAALPSLDDVARLDLRKKMMDEMEQLEWQVAVHHCAPNAPRAKPACRASLAMEQRMQLYHAAVVAVGLLSGARGGNTAAARGTAAALLDRALRQAHSHQKL